MAEIKTPREFTCDQCGVTGEEDKTLDVHDPERWLQISYGNTTLMDICSWECLAKFVEKFTFARGFFINVSKCDTITVENDA